MHIVWLGGPGPTSPDQVWSANPDHPVGLISTIGLDLIFDQTGWSSPVLLGPFGTLSRRRLKIPHLTYPREKCWVYDALLIMIGSIKLCIRIIFD